MHLKNTTIEVFNKNIIRCLYRCNPRNVFGRYSKSSKNFVTAISRQKCCKVDAKTYTMNFYGGGQQDEYA
jgi:hypothetical protein